MEEAEKTVFPSEDLSNFRQNNWKEFGQIFFVKLSINVKSVSRCSCEQCEKCFLRRKKARSANKLKEPPDKVVMLARKSMVRASREENCTWTEGSAASVLLRD